MSNKENNPTNSGSDLPPEGLKATDWAILKHVSLYHFTIRQAVEALFFSTDVSQKDSSAKAGTALDSLARQGYLKNREHESQSKTNGANKTKGISASGSEKPEVLKVGTVKYYLLGGKSNLLASKGFTFPKERLVPPNTEQSFYKHVAALWYCLFDGPRRYRLDQKELSKLWAGLIPANRKIPHQPAFCLAEEAQGPVIYRLYPTMKTKAAQVLVEVRKKLEHDATSLGLKHWLDTGEYGYAIVVPSKDRSRDVKRELTKFQKQNPHLASARLTVHYAPTPPLLGKALRDRDDGGL